MRVLGVGEANDLGDLYRRLLLDGHEVRVFASDPSCAGVLEGLVPRTSDWRRELGWVGNGGLISYGIDQVDLYRRVPTYIDRIFKGAKPAELPVQLPTRFELAVNLKTAKSLGIEMPPMLLGRADEVIE